MRLISFLMFSLFIELNLLTQIQANKVPCERIVEVFELHKTCFMDSVTKIDNLQFEISSERDENVTKISLYGNKNVIYLPISVSEKFPSLTELIAWQCSVKEISKENFKNLYKLQRLDLDENQITKIQSETFEDLMGLEVLRLVNNKIRFLNAHAFMGLTKLRLVRLKGNVCINKDFEEANSIAELKLELNGMCKFEEIGFVDCAKETATFREETLALKALLNKTMVSQTQCESHLNTKMQEIADLLDETQMKNAELNNKNLKIKNLEAKLKLVQENNQCF